LDPSLLAGNYLDLEINNANTQDARRA